MQDKDVFIRQSQPKKWTKLSELNIDWDKYLPENLIAPDGSKVPHDDRDVQVAVERYYNEQRRLADEKRELEKKRQDEEYWKKRNEEEERRRQKKLEEQLEYERTAVIEQFEVYVSGRRYLCNRCNSQLHYEACCHNRGCAYMANVRGFDIEPMFKLDDDTRSRLEQFSDSVGGEKSFQNVLSKLLDIAEAKSEGKGEGKGKKGRRNNE